MAVVADFINQVRVRILVLSLSNPGNCARSLPVLVDAGSDQLLQSCFCRMNRYRIERKFFVVSMPLQY